MKRKIFTLIALVLSSQAYGSFSTWATPWTKSFLEMRLDAEIERSHISLRKDSDEYSRNKNIGTIIASGAPLPNWEVSALLSGSNTKTRKIAGRIEHQILSDLKISPVSLTTLLELCVATNKRASEPAFFEMAKKYAQVGLGLGRHLGIAHFSYTQLFSYLMGGMSTSFSRWASLEIGLAHTYAEKHSFRASVTHLRSYSTKSGPFRGFGGEGGNINSASLGYFYTTSGGLKWKLSYIYRHFQKGVARSNQTARLSLSFPITF